MLTWTASLISKSLPSSRADHHRPEQFKLLQTYRFLCQYRWNLSFEIYISCVYPKETMVCLKSICPAYIENYVSKIPSSKIYCIFGYTKGANVSVSSHIMNIRSSMIACCNALFVSKLQFDAIMAFIGQNRNEVIDEKLSPTPIFHFPLCCQCLSIKLELQMLSFNEFPWNFSHVLQTSTAKITTNL